MTIGKNSENINNSDIDHNIKVKHYIIPVLIKVYFLKCIYFVLHNSKNYFIFGFKKCLTIKLFHSSF